MFILGLTGSIGMGKSATAALFQAAGIAVSDADAHVHALYSGAAAPLIEAEFPGTVRDGTVDRHTLGQRVLNDPAAMARLEAIVHPLARAAKDQFVGEAFRRGDRLVVLDIPLLFESHAEDMVDAILVVSAPETVQKARVLLRPGMTQERFASIIARQSPDAEKRRRAHFIIETGSGLASAKRQVAGLLRSLASVEGQLLQGRKRDRDD